MRWASLTVGLVLLATPATAQSLGGVRLGMSEVAAVEDKRVECVAQHRSNDRVVAVCCLRGQSVGDLMRSAGVREGGRGRQ